MTIESLVRGADLSDKELLGFALPELPVGGHSTEALHGIGARMAGALGRSAWACLAPQLVFDPRQYRRVRLWRNASWEALLLCWLPGHHTTIHDHGGSTGVSLVLMGALHEARYSWEGEGCPLRPAGCGDLSAGEVTYELDDTIHEISNESAAPSASLHLYSPPLEVLGAYDMFEGRRREVPVADRPAVQVGGDPDLTRA